MITCDNCKEELQPDEIMGGFDVEGNLIKVCSFCGCTEIMEEKQLK